MSLLQAHNDALYELRFSPMCKPACEVANLTQLESHTTRARTMMMWQIVNGMLEWTPRRVELIYQSTLDSISEAFDIAAHFPVSQYMLDARADIWAMGMVPEHVQDIVAASATQTSNAESAPKADTLLLAGEVAQTCDETLIAPLEAALKSAGVEAAVWNVPSGALAYALGSREAARGQAAKVVEGIKASGAQTIIADGPETMWALTKIFPALDVSLPEGVSVKLLSETLVDSAPSLDLGKVFVHDSRPACLIADEMAESLAILPGYLEDETAFGTGAVYEAPRQILDAMGAERVFTTWTRSLAKSSGADDGLWLTYPELAAGLAEQRLDTVERLGATMLVTDSPLAAAYLSKHTEGRNIEVKLLAALFM